MQSSNLPCVECCNLDLTCCRNPQILWTMEEIDELVEQFPDALKRKTFVKGEVPGMAYILIKPSKRDLELGETHIDSCAFYDEDNRRCSIYQARPNVCKTFGDPKYATCPYDGLTETDLIELLKMPNKYAEKMHILADSQPENYFVDFILPWSERFNNSKEKNPEWFEWWENLPLVDWTREI